MKYLSSPNGEIYPLYRNYVLNRFNPFALISEYGGLDLGIFENGKWSSRPRTIWGWGIHRYRYYSPPVSFRIERLVRKQVLKNSNLGSFLKFWKGQKREPGLI